MASPSYCTECGDFMVFPESHRCAPVYRACVVDHDDPDDPPSDWPSVRASYPDEAAERRAEQYDQDDHTMMSGHEIVVLVCDPQGKITRWRVSGEAVKRFHAQQLEEGA